MKRVVLIALSVALFAGVANAQFDPGTASVWIQFPGGGNEVNILVSETCVFQLWMDYTAPETAGVERLMIGMDALHQMLPAPPVLPEDPAQCIEVIGWTGPGAASQYGPWGINGTFFTKSRGIMDEAPFDGIPDYTGCGNFDGIYMYIATVNGPYTNQTGLPPNGGAMMLDETIIHGNCDTGTTFNKVFFASGAQAPTWTETTIYGGDLVIGPKTAFALGTGINKKNALKFHVSIPEPGSLALLAFGGLAAIRRRR